jgi:tripartite-type tricarboxylate transporter receptor subunit TctC
MPQQKTLVAAFATLAALTLATGAVSQSAYPSKPVRMLVGTAPGGNPDVLGRILAHKLSGALGQPVIVENLPGAGGAMPAVTLAKTPSDPHLLMLADSGALAISPALTPDITYNPLRDFTPITALAAVPTVLVVHPSLGVSTLSEFIRLAKEKPSQINYGSASPGSIHHLTMETFTARTGIRLTHLPYRSGAALVAAVISGEVQAAWSGIPNVLEPIADGRLRVLGISIAERSKSLPNVPTIQELGVPDFDIATVMGMLTTAGAAPDVVKKLQGAIATTLREPDIVARFDQLGMILRENGTENYARLMKDDVERYAKAVKAAGLGPTK